MKKPIIVRFKDWNCKLVFRYYGNNRTAIQLLDASDGGPVATATVNIPECPLEEDQVIIKTYSENEGMLRALMDAGVVSSPVSYVQSGFVTCPICKLLIKQE